MDAAAVNNARSARSDLLLQHCFALDTERRRPTALDRLEVLLGPELARRLVAALTPVQ